MNRLKINLNLMGDCQLADGCTLEFGSEILFSSKIRHLGAKLVLLSSVLHKILELFLDLISKAIILLTALPQERSFL